MTYWNDELRRFGLVVGGVFFALAAWFLLRSSFASTGGRVLGVAALVFLVPAFLRPPALRPLRAAWMALAHVLGWINTHLILGAVYYLLFTFTRLVLSALRKDPLHRRPDPALATYWLDVSEGEATPESLEHPF